MSTLREPTMCDLTVLVSILNAKRERQRCLERNPVPISIVKLYDDLIASLENHYASPSR